MDEAALRKWMEKHSPAFGKLSSKLKKVVWEECNEEGFIEAALDPELLTGKDEMLKKVQRIIKRIQAAREHPSPPGRSHQQESRPSLKHDEWLRAAVLSDYIAKHAATTALVRRFRCDVLQGGVVSQEQAVAFLNSPAACVLEQKRFAACGVPLFDHRAQVVDQTGLVRIPTVVGGTHCIIHRQHATLQIEWPGGTCEETRTYESLPLLPWDSLEPPPTLYFLERDNEMQCVDPWPVSILSVVGEVSRALAKRYSGLWTEAQATMFVLTDVAPFLSPLQVHRTERSYDINDAFPNDDPRKFQNAPWPLSLARSQITITVDAWVSDETVLRAYRRAQRQMLNRDNRPPREQSLALVRFVADLEKLFEMTWDARMTAWNKAQINPDWQYTDVRHFYEAFRRAERLLCYPETPVQNGARRKSQRQRRTGTG